MKVLKSLQEVRVQLQKMNLKKSGENKFAGFKYYELADFLPAINELCLKAGLVTQFTTREGDEYTTDKAILSIKSVEDLTNLDFEIPFIIPELKGGNAVQNLGAGITYLRRYLFINAFEISEADVSDAVMHQETPKTSQNEAKPEKAANTTADKSKAKEMCIYGKNIGKRWDTMSKTQLAWYRDNFLKNEKLSFTDALALETIQNLLGININQPVEEDIKL